jgi:hypothetical protein
MNIQRAQNIHFRKKISVNTFFCEEIFERNHIFLFILNEENQLNFHSLKMVIHRIEIHHN